jgi:hypothetical protein
MICSPSGVTAIPQTELVWPVRVARCSPVRRFHTRAGPVLACGDDLLAIRSPPPPKTEPVWPPNGRSAGTASTIRPVCRQWNQARPLATSRTARLDVMPSSATARCQLEPVRQRRRLSRDSSPVGRDRISVIERRLCRRFPAPAPQVQDINDLILQKLLDDENVRKQMPHLVMRSIYDQYNTAPASGPEQS